MKRNKIFITIILALLGMLSACKSDFLDVKPKGVLSVDVLATADGVDALLIGAYSMLDGVSSQFSWESASSNWVFGSIRALEATKGSDAGDQPPVNSLQTFSEDATNDYLLQTWESIYESISRCNSAITVNNTALSNGAITQEQHDLFNMQAVALRGWYHFEAWRMWNKIPYVDEKTDALTVKNDVDVRDKIMADLAVGLDLPLNMGQIGRWNKTVVEAEYARAEMQMYHDATHYDDALVKLQDVVATGVKPDGTAIGLAPTFGEVFDIANRNGIESIYTVQYSVNDNSGGWNGGYGEVLNFPYKGNDASPGGCCGFFCPTQEFVNSFRTNNGLPLLDFSYNADPVKNDEGLAPTDAFTTDAGPLDPRLDWSVGRRGIPYWDWGLMTGSDWIRDQTYSGPYCAKKEVYKKSQEGKWTEVGNWTSGYTANGYRMIRYADVILLIAECDLLKSTPDLTDAIAKINMIRNRAANPAGFVTMPDNSPAADYVINPYTNADIPDIATGIKALQMERKLELGEEGHRWFDLNRWNNTQTELARVLAVEKTNTWGANLYGNAVVGPNVNLYPIPQRQIDLSNGNITQNR